MVEEPGAEEGEEEGDDDRDRYPDDAALADPGERRRQAVVHVARGVHQRQAAQAGHHAEGGDERRDLDERDQEAGQTPRRPPNANITPTPSAGCIPSLMSSNPITVTRARREPTERSMPALVMTKVMPTARMM